jgi:predicted nuclease with TOPRIM domain
MTNEDYVNLLMFMFGEIQKLKSKQDRLEKEIETLKHIVIPVVSEEKFNGYIAFDCDDCEYREWCMGEFGKEYQCIIGTTFCRKSWDEYMNG